MILVIADKKTKEDQEKYIRQTSKEDRKRVRRTIKEMINNYDNGNEELFVLNLILDNPHLLKKTKLAFDGSYRNIRVCAFDDYEDYDCYEERHFTSLDIDWENAVGRKIDWDNYSEFHKAITKEDIIEVLNNIEEIFIQ